MKDETLSECTRQLISFNMIERKDEYGMVFVLHQNHDNLE